MNPNPDWGIRSAVAAVAAGVFLALMGALEPFAPNAFHLRGLVLAAGLLPYFALGMFAGILRGPILTGAAAAVLIPHLFVVILTGAQSPARTWVPLLLTLLLGLLIPPAARALRLADLGTPPESH